MHRLCVSLLNFAILSVNVQINFRVSLPFHLIKSVGLSERIILLLEYLGNSAVHLYIAYILLALPFRVLTPSLSLLLCSF